LAAALQEEEQRGEEEVVAKAAEIQEAIQDGASAFCTTEYKYMGVFMVSALGWLH
jgi:Na+/H+-translocating membrane pyrophosphatase